MRKILSLAFVTMGLAVSAQGTYEDVIAEILNNNAQLQSLSKEITATRLEAKDENTLANPTVDFARVWGRHGIGNKLQLDISQEFSWPGLYSMRGKAADMQQMAGEAERQTAIFSMTVDIRQLLNELVYVRQQLHVIEDLKLNFKNLSDAIDKGVRGGELTVLDQRKMQIENYEIDNDMATALAREQQIIGELNALTAKPLDLSHIVSYPIQQTLTLDEYLQSATSDPEAAALALMADFEALNAKAAAQSRIPSLSVGYQHQAEMGDRFNGFTVGIKLPFFEGRNARRAALERQQAAEINRDRVVDKRQDQIRATYAEMEIYRDRVTVYNKTFGDNLYLSLLLKAYNGGQISVIDYLSELHYYHQNMLAYIESEYNYQQALTSLNCYTLIGGK